MSQQPHFLLVTFPAQGHINPSLHFAERLIRIGVRVTFVTCLSAHRHIAKHPAPDGLYFATFSDGHDDGFDATRGDSSHYMNELKRRGSETLTQLIKAAQNEGRPFTCLVYTILLSWAAEVARELHLPHALLWIQPALVFGIYYYHFYGYGDFIKEKAGEPSGLIDLPGLPLLTTRDLPSFLVPSSPHAFVLPSFKEQFELLVEEDNPKILFNTFDALEAETLRAIDKFNMVAIGPLISSVFLDLKDSSDTSFRADLFDSSNDSLEWLNSKPPSSVIYVSFGSLCVLEKRQMEEIAQGLLMSGHPFLWVVREKRNNDGDEEKEADKLISFIEELNHKGMIVPWCSQAEVLTHQSLGCFITHCGWNSTLESLVSGVPVVAFPQWTDQGTNAKLLVDICKTGVRVNTNGEGIVESDELKRCLELVMGEGETRDEFRENAKKWKDLASEAAKDVGSSDKNLRAFVDEVVGLSQ